MQTREFAGVIRLLLAVTVFTSVTAVHAEDRTAQYNAAITSIEHFNKVQREADMPEMDVPTYEEWLTTEQEAVSTATVATAAAAPVAAISSGQGGSPPPSAPLTGGLTAAQLFQIWATHCGNSTNAADSDSDLDGISDLEEVLAGTNPDDEYDYFSLVEFELQATNMLVSYVSETLREYELQTSTNLLLYSWTVTGTATGTGDIITHSIPLATFQHYRANVAGAPDSDGDDVPDWLEYCAGMSTEPHRD